MRLSLIFLLGNSGFGCAGVWCVNLWIHVPEAESLDSTPSLLALGAYFDRWLGTRKSRKMLAKQEQMEKERDA